MQFKGGSGVALFVSLGFAVPLLVRVFLTVVWAGFRER